MWKVKHNALQLAAEWRDSMPTDVMRMWAADVRDELRRQHAEIERLRAKLDELEKQEPVAVKNHNPHLHMVGPDDGGRVSIDELSAIPIGTKLYLAAGAVEQAQESDQHRVSDCDPLLLAYFDAYARTLVKKPHKMTPEMWPEGFPFFKAGFERSVTAHARPVEPVQKLRPDFIAGYDAGMADAKRIQAAQPAPAAVVGPTNKVLWLLMAQYGLNMTVGQDMDNLLNFGRDVWNAALSTIQPAPAAQADARDAAQLYPVVIDGLLWLCAKHGGTFKPVDDCAAVNPPLSWKNALAANKKEPT